MKIISSINDISQFNIHENIYLDTKGRINFESHFSCIKEFVCFKHSTLLIGKGQKIINNNDFPNIPENFTYKYNSASKNYFILVDSNSLDFETFICTKEAFYSIEEKKTIFINDLAGNRIFHEYSVGQIGRNDCLFVIHIPSQTKIVNFSLSILGSWLDGGIEKPYQVAEFCEIYKTTLVCTMTNGAILLLDIETGEIKAFFKDAKVKGGVFQKEENSPIFLGLKHYTFLELNAQTGEIIRQVDIQNELKRIRNIPYESPCWISVGTSIYQDGLFYFYGDTNLIGIFDPNSEKIIDYHEFEFDKKQYQQLKGGVENLQVKDGKIYCLDTLGNLYEIEK